MRPQSASIVRCLVEIDPFWLKFKCVRTHERVTCVEIDFNSFVPSRRPCFWVARMEFCRHASRLVRGHSSTVRTMAEGEWQARRHRSQTGVRGRGRMSHQQVVGREEELVLTSRFSFNESPQFGSSTGRFGPRGICCRRPFVWIQMPRLWQPGRKWPGWAFAAMGDFKGSELVTLKRVQREERGFDGISCPPPPGDT